MQFHFDGVLSPHDAKKHIEHAFVISEDRGQLRIRLWHSEGQANGLSNMLTLTVFGPDGFRGAGHRMGELRDGGRAHDVSINPTNATPGYTAGEVQRGQWSVVIDTHRITDAEPCVYRLDVEASTAPAVSFPKAELAPQNVLDHNLREDFAQGWRWYRGDLHAHTVHSDGRWDVPDLVTWARQHRLDFVTLSDHNTVSGLAQMDAQSSRGLLTMGGLELTTFYGHALALGVRDWVDWRVGAGGRRRPMLVIAQEIESVGGLFIIAHPMAAGDPICTGCRWMYADTMPGPARVVEIWNGGTWNDSDSHNELGLALFYEWLNRGDRLVATAGTDIHGPMRPDDRPGFNVVFAEAHTERAILDAIRQGHLFVSSGPHVECVAHSASGRRAMMGDALPADESAAFTAAWTDCAADDRIRLLADGELLYETPSGRAGVCAWHFDANQVRWIMIEIRDEAGLVAAVTNPIFFSTQQTDSG